MSIRGAVAFAILGLVSAHPVRAQMPDTDIWLADVMVQGDSLSLGQPVNVTHRPGYDNQPAFLSHPVGAVDHRWPLRFLFTSADSLGATDIFLWDSDTRAATRVTHTPESEYSPTPFADWRGSAGFFTVRVEADSTQRLWKFNSDGTGPQVVASKVDSVGYFAFIDDRHVAMFVLGNEARKEPHTLRVVDLKTQHETIVARDIGRCIQRIPGTNDIMFTLRNPDGTYRFCILKHGKTAGEPLINAVEDGQDAAWLDAHTLLMSAGTTIYAARPVEKTGGEWHAVRNFVGDGISSITRIAVSPDGHQIAFVATPATP
ncbi:MAG TPA: hypothetical protein VFH88_08345 [Candidatus Krumholzibacteria bacterium]|nr:hypothetical protein [Candidatus Krumholzibacteria bacterium]